MADEAEWRFQLRATDELRDQLSLAAQEDGRSLNKEVIWLLTSALSQRKFWQEQKHFWYGPAPESD